MTKLFSTLLLMILSTQLFAAAKTVCTHHEATREIEVVYDATGQSVPCSVVYRKDGMEQILWSAQAEEGFCESKADAFIEKQRGWGWSCAESMADPSSTMSMDEPADMTDESSMEDEAMEAADDSLEKREN